MTITFIYILLIDGHLEALPGPKNCTDPNGPYIRTSQAKIRNVCLSVISVFLLLSFVLVLCLMTYLLKVPYNILDYPIVAGFLIYQILGQLFEKIV